MKYRILLVEGADPLRPNPFAFLTAAGPHTVERVSSINAALELTRAHSFDVALISLDLATAAAYATLDRLTHTARDIPVVVLVRDKDDAQERAALRAGAACVIEDDTTLAAVEAQIQSCRAVRAERRDSVQQRGIERIQSASGAYAAAVCIVEDTQTIRVIDSCGYDADVIRRFRVMPLSADVPIAWAINNGTPLFLTEDTWNAQFPRSKDERSSGSRGWAALPVMRDGRAVGGLVLSYDMPVQFSESSKQAVLQIAEEHAARVISSSADGSALVAQLDENDVKQQLRTVLDATTDCIKLIDRSGIVLQMNRSGEKLLGRPAQDVIGQSVTTFVAPEFHETVRQCLAAAFSGQIVDCELEVITRDDRRLSVESRLLGLRDTAGDINAVIAITRDVTSDRQARAALIYSERHFRNVVENLSDGVLEIDENATILYINQMSQTVLGYRPEEMIGRAGWLFVHPDDMDELRRNLEARLAGSESTGVSEVRMRHRDGSWRVLQLRARRYNAGPPRDARVLVTARDVTDTRQIERDLQHTREQLLQAQKLDAIGRLAGGIAHDFNNLLTAIGGHADLLIDGLAPHHPMYTDLKEIRVSVERAAALTRQLLAFSRKQVLQTTVIDVRELVKDTHSMLRRLIGEGIEIEMSLTDEPAQVRADYTQLQQVLVNLAVNARDALTRGGRIRIDVSIDETRGHRRVRLRVADNGSGMDEETKQRIFEPFFTTKEPGKGTGLGLPTVYGIVQQSGGQIEVATALGVGTTVDIFLPATDAAVTGRPKTARDVLPQTGRETILLVEDEAAVREVTARMLRRGGYSVLEAGHPDQALDVARNTIQDITMVLTDVGLPGLTGPEMVEHLLDIRPDVKVIFTSGYANDEIFAEGRTASRFTFIEKPFTATALLACVRSVLDN